MRMLRSLLTALLVTVHTGPGYAAVDLLGTSVKPILIYTDLSGTRCMAYDHSWQTPNDPGYSYVPADCNQDDKNQQFLYHEDNGKIEMFAYREYHRDWMKTWNITWCLHFQERVLPNHPYLQMRSCDTIHVGSPAGKEWTITDDGHIKNNVLDNQCVALNNSTNHYWLVDCALADTFGEHVNTPHPTPAPTPAPSIAPTLSAQPSIAPTIQPSQRPSAAYHGPLKTMNEGFHGANLYSDHFPGMCLASWGQMDVGLEPCEAGKESQTFDYDPSTQHLGLSSGDKCVMSIPKTILMDCSWADPIGIDKAGRITTTKDGVSTCATSDGSHQHSFSPCVDGDLQRYSITDPALNDMADDIPPTAAPSAATQAPTVTTPTPTVATTPSPTIATPAPTVARTPATTGPAISGPHKASSHGDPHFKTFSGVKYDFHGGCDLVLFDNTNFANGLGMAVHIRTKINTWWSYIASAVLRVGTNTLEVMGGAKGGQFWINGKEQKEPNDGDVLSLSGLQVSFHRVSNKQLRFRLDFGRGDVIALETIKDFVSVNIRAKTDQFKGSVGLLGSFPEGEMLARDGMTILEDPIAFGQEWQVLESEPMLFHSVESPQHPEACVMPDERATKTKRRRLGEAFITDEDAAIACAHANEDDKDACIFDVLATNDKEMAGTY